VLHLALLPPASREIADVLPDMPNANVSRQEQPLSAP
jgi:hypothetical protein